MKKTHFFQLDFHPGDFCWYIVPLPQGLRAERGKITRVIHALDIDPESNPKKSLQEYVRSNFYQLENGLSIIEPLKTLKEAEALIEKTEKELNRN